MDYKSSVENLNQDITSLISNSSQPPIYSEIKEVDAQIPTVTAVDADEKNITPSEIIAPYMLSPKISVRKYRLKK